MLLLYGVAIMVVLCADKIVFISASEFAEAEIGFNVS